MTRNSQLSTTEPKKKKSKTQNKLSTLEQEQNHWNIDHMEYYSIITRWGENKGNGTENKKHNW